MPANQNLNPNPIGAVGGGLAAVDPRTPVDYPIILGFGITVVPGIQPGQQSEGHVYLLIPNVIRIDRTYGANGSAQLVFDLNPQ